MFVSDSSLQCITTVQYAKHLLDNGAYFNLKPCNNWTALEWVEKWNQSESAAGLIEAQKKTYGCLVEHDAASQNKSATILGDDKLLLDIYHNLFNEKQTTHH